MEALEGEEMPWRAMDVQQQRVEFVTAAKRGGRPFRSLCEEFGISRPTGYLWLRRPPKPAIESPWFSCAVTCLGGVRGWNVKTLNEDCTTGQ